VPIRQEHFKCESVTVRTAQSWNLSSGDSVNFKLSDILKRSGIQYIVPVIRVNPAGYNDTNSQKEFSGFHYLTYKYRELFGDKHVTDFTDARLLQKKEMDYYYNQFGRKQLNSNIWKNTDDLNKFWLRTGRISFDGSTAVENAHELIYETDSTLEDYDITLYSNTNAFSGSLCDVVVIMVYYEEFEFQGNQLVKIN
jgi:hypothetical protein